jgi:outer membrane biosynthesis protein TonB
MNSLQRSGQSLGALAAALLLGSSSTLPALAALPRSPLTELPKPLSSESALMLARSNNNESDDKKKKKKKEHNNQQPNQKHQPSQPKPSSKQQHKEKPRKNSKQNTKDSIHNTANPPNNSKPNNRQDRPGSQINNHTNNKSSSHTKTQHADRNRTPEKPRNNSYDRGREDGLKKGREKGFEKGYDKGFEAGKKKGRNDAYRNAKRREWQSWNRDQWYRYNRSRRDIWVRPVTYNRPFYGYPTWAQNPNWGYNRPWNNGWYSSSNPSWSWWGGQALGWGINALTTALIVNSAINNAIRDRQPTVVVPNSSMQLYYGSVEAKDESDVTFVVANGNDTYQMEADCEDGLLNGEVPTALPEAELVNTACQVAFGAT